MRKCAKFDAFTHSHIRDRVSPLRIEPESSSDAAQNVTQLTKCESPKPKILNICRHRRSHDIAYSPTSLIFRFVGEVGENSHRCRRSRPFLGEVGEIGDYLRRSHRTPPIFGEICEICGNSRRSRRFHREAGEVGGDPHRSRRYHPFFGELGAVGENSLRSHRPRPFSVSPTSPIFP